MKSKTLSQALPRGVYLDELERYRTPAKSHDEVERDRVLVQIVTDQMAREKEATPFTLGTVARGITDTLILGFFGLLVLGAVCAVALKVFHWVF